MRNAINLVVCIAALLTSQQTVAANNVDAGKFKIGMTLCLTGACAELGTNTQRGAELAAKEIDERGGVLGKQIEFVIQDTNEAASGAGAVNAFKNISTDQSIQYYIGPTWTSAGLALAPIVSKLSGIIYTSPTLGVASFNEAADNIFNIWPHDESSTRALARYAISRGWKKIGILSSQQPWCLDQGRIFADEIKKQGGSVTALVEPEPNTLDLRNEVLRISRTSPDVIFFSNYLQNGMSAEILRKYKYKGQILLILLDRTQLGLAHGALNNAMYASTPPAQPSFEQKYSAQFKAAPGTGSATGYDSVMLYAQAIEQAKTFDPLVVKKVLSKLTLDGASGKLIFDEKGGVKSVPYLYRVNGEKIETLGAIE